MRDRLLTALALVLALPAALTAHPLHGDGGVHGLWHFLSSPDHAAGIAAVLATAIWVGLRRARKARDARR